MYGEAITDFTEAIDLEPKDAAAYFDQGLAYEREGQFLEAISASMPSCERVARQFNGRAYFNSSNSITTDVFAWMLWRRPLGIWTQVPGRASMASSPSVNTASP